MMQKRGLVLHDPGVGKTPPICTFIYWMATSKSVGTCWVMPKSLLLKNRAELLRFSEFEEDDVVIIDGSKKQRDALLAKPVAVMLMGAKRFQDEWQKIKQQFPYMNMIVVDESHLAYPTWESGRTQALYAATQPGGFEYFFVMTGSIIKGRLSSAFPAIHIIEPRYYGTYGGFLTQHAVRDEFGTIIGWTNHEKLGRIFGCHGIRRTFAAEYGPEAKVIQVEDVDLMGAHETVYKEWHEKAMLELDENYLTSANGAVHAMRARQILAHPEALLIPSMMNKVTARDERLAVEMEDVKHTGERYVSFSCFIPEVERIARLGTKIGLRTGLLHGGITSKRRGEIELDFREGRLDFLSVNPTVAGIGYNWPFLQRMAHTSLDYGDDSFIQAYRRGIRGVRDTNLLIQVFGYKNTIDWRVRSIIERKSRDAHAVDPSYEIVELNRRPAAP